MIWPFKGEIFMRAFLLALCLVFVSAGNSANAGGFLSRILDPQADMKEQIDQAHAEQEAKDRERQAREKEERGRQARKQEEDDRVAKEQFAKTMQEARGKPLAATYNRRAANLQALVCSDPQQQTDCKIYFAGFADMVALMYAMNSKTNGLCGSTTDLVHEFIQEVRINPKARDGEAHKVLFALLARDHSCAKVKGRFQYSVSAGSLMDTCHIGDIGFNLCSQYQAGFISALLFLSEQAGEPILCGHESLITSVNVTGLLNERLQTDFKLRRDPAVMVMLDGLRSNMPCNPAPVASDTLPKDVTLLIAQAETLNDKCRGGSGDDPATEKACGERDVVFRKIKAKNWCWGHDGQVSADRTWERCSNR